MQKLKCIFIGNRVRKTENRFFPYLQVMSDAEEYDFLGFLRDIAFDNKTSYEILIDDSLRPTIAHLKKALDEVERNFRDYNIKNKIGNKHGIIYTPKRRI